MTASVDSMGIGCSRRRHKGVQPDFTVKQTRLCPGLVWVNYKNQEYLEMLREILKQTILTFLNYDI